MLQRTSFGTFWCLYPELNWLPDGLNNLIEGSLEVKLPTIWTDEKQSMEEAERRERLERKKSRRERVRRKKMQMREKVGKSRNTVFFQWFVAPEGRKVGSLKRRVRAAGQMRDEKLHTVVARSTFASQNVQSTSALDHFWKLRCRKSARRCGRKHISKSKCTKHTIVGPLWEVAMSKKCTPLWREAHFEVKMYKHTSFGPLFGSWDVEKVHAVVARSTFRSQNVQNTRGSDSFGGSDVASLRFGSLHYSIYTPLHYSTLHYTTLHSHTTTTTTELHNYHSTTLRYII